MIAPVIRNTTIGETTSGNAGGSRERVFSDTYSTVRRPAIVLVVVLLALLGYAVFRLSGESSSGLPSHVGKADIAIAVLPFTNISGHPDQDYIANGITEDVITDLSRFSRLLVISRSSVLGYAGTSASAGQSAANWACATC